MLHDRDGALDLMLRGFDRERVLERTGEDIGYNGRKLRAAAGGVDRLAYKVEHVLQRVEAEDRSRALELVERGQDRATVLGVLGLGPAGPTTLAAVFAGVGLKDEFEAARSKGRRAQLEAGMLAAHGVVSGFQLPQVQGKSAEVRQERYGAAYTLATGSSLADRARATIRSHRAGRRDDAVFQSLRAQVVERFGAADVREAYQDDRRPVADLYVVSRDLFIDLIDGGALGQELVSAGAEHQLNQVVFRRSLKGMDVDLWSALGCPDGRDWEFDGSWVGSRIRDELSAEVAWPARLTGSVGVSRKAARAANGAAFYARELALWAANPMTKKGSLRLRLLCNRHHYVGELPDQLGDLALLRGMRVSGLVRGYTAFDNTGMVQVLERYRPSSVYDPCAGWGERMATCAGLGVGYLGVDINDAVVSGHQRMIGRYGLTEQGSMVVDAARFDARGRDHEMVFTCPPYGSVEVYTAEGAENLEPEAFLDWWSQVVAMSTSDATRVFAYQINQAWRDAMNARVLAQGWQLVDQIDVGRHAVSHFNRDVDGTVTREEFEQVQVFESAGSVGL